MIDIIVDTIIDVLKLIPFLFVAFLLIEKYKFSHSILFSNIFSFSNLLNFPYLQIL